MYVCAHLSINSLLFINANQGVHYKREIIEFNYILNKYLRYSLMCVFNSSHHTVQDFLISLIRRERKKRRKSRKKRIFVLLFSEDQRITRKVIYITFLKHSKKVKSRKVTIKQIQKSETYFIFINSSVEKVQMYLYKKDGLLF